MGTAFSTRTTPSHLAGIALVAAFVAIALQLPEQVREAGRAGELARSWADRDAQYRALLGDVPYDFLREADRRLPRGASVLLVTPGTDVRPREYTTFHRALYFLAPRPVHWITPAPADGTWEARWWKTSPIDPISVCAAAADSGVDAILLLDLGPPTEPCPTAAWDVQSLPGGTLVRLSTEGRPEGTSDQLNPAWPVQLGVALAIPLVLGAWLILRTARAGLVLATGQRLALAWIVGSGIVSLAVPVLSTLGVSPSVRNVLIGGTALALLATMARAALPALARAAAGWRGQRSAAQTNPTGTAGGLRRLVPRPALVPTVLAALIAIELALTGIMAVGQPLAIWDGWAHWGMKARVLHADGAITASTFADMTRASAHLHYPLGVPILEAWVYEWLGAPDDRLVGFVGILAYAALLALCHGTMRAWGASPSAALAVAALVGATAPVWRLAAAGYADVPMALQATAALVLLVAWLQRGRWAALVLAAAIAGLMGWTKMEGLALVGVVVILLGAAWLGGRGRRGGLPARAGVAAIAIAVGTALVSGAWWGFVAMQSVGGQSIEYELRPAIALANLDRLGTIASMQLALLASPQWSFIWPAALLTAASWFVVRRRPVVAGVGGPRGGWLLPASAAAYLVVMSGAYVVTTYAPYTAQIDASAYRLALHVFPVTALWLAGRLLGPGSEPALPRPAP